MRVRHIALFLISATFVCGVPNSVFAATDITDDVVSDTEWNASGSPYVISSGLTIQSGATLTIEPGVVVQFDSGGIDVLGRLLAKGTFDEPILFTSATGNRWGGIRFSNPEISSSLDHIAIRYARTGITDFYSKDLSISNARIEDGEFGIEAIGSHLSLSNFSAENMSGEALDISYGSDVILQNITLKNIHEGIDLYVDSKADISNLSVDQAQNQALVIYIGSSAHIANSIISNTGWPDAIAVFNSSFLTAENVKVTNGTGDGVVVFNGSSVTVQDSVISGFTQGTGAADYGGWMDIPNALSLKNNKITNNDTGIGLYADNSSYAISDNSIHGNASYGLTSYGTVTADVSNNFWGDPSGPYNDPGNLTGKGNAIWYAPDGTVIFSPWLSYWGTPPVSNVLFLPGIEGSRLYRPNYTGGTDKVWEPNIDADVKDLYMNPDGTSVRFDVYTKEGDVINELPDGENIYKSFMGKMDDLKTSGAINDWEPIAYDWRLSLDDILNYGNDVGGRIYYSGDLRATSTPYIIQELRRLAATSKSGKITIVAHSNGGLLAKRLTQVLGSTDAAKLIDKIIFVAVPQAGTPAAIAAGLHGYDQSNAFGLVTSKNTARTLAANSPMTYNLSPSAQYFTYVDNPVITFDAALTDWISRYGSVIHSESSLHQFLTDTYGRVDAQTGDINQPIQFSSSLLSSAETLHSAADTGLDNWTVPTGVELIQIAGWGVPKTVEGVTYKKKGTGIEPNADFTIDGDGTVVVPSALWTSTTTGAVNYWVDLKSFNTLENRILGLRLKAGHGSILEVSELLDLISNNLLLSKTDPLPDFISTSTPIAERGDVRLRYALHSPLTLNLYDDQGRHTGVSTTTGNIEEQIPGTYYTEFGDVKYLFSDASTPAHIVMNGYEPGTFTFNVDQYSGDTLTASTTFKDIPTTASTVVALDVQSDISTLSPMQIDENGDGKNIITLTPKLGETVNYEPPAPEPAPEPAISSVGSRGGGGGRVAAPITVPAPVATAMNTPEIITQPVVTNTPKVVAITKPVQVKNKMPVAVAPSKKVTTNIPQTASVYQAFQQSVLTWLGTAVYNGLHGFWVAFKSLF